MKRLLIAILILGILLIACFIPVIKRSEAKIEASIIDVSMQLKGAERWKLWHTPLKQAFEAKPSSYLVTNNYNQYSFSMKTPQLSYTVINPDAGTFEIKVVEKNKPSYFRLRLSVIPETPFTKVIAETKTAFIKTLFPVNSQDEIQKKICENLKVFMETPRLYYGFPIHMKGVVDSNVAVLKKTVSGKEKFSILPHLLKDLIKYASTHKLTVMQPPMLQFHHLGKDSLNIVVMLATDKPGPNEKNINCGKMPAGGRMLVGQFRGKFADRTRLNTAMEKYILDKNLVSIVNSYEKYHSYPLPEEELSEVDLEIYYPIL